MRLYHVIVIRKQVWEYSDLEANSKEEAMDRAEQMSLKETPCDDYLYDTLVQEEAD